MAGAGWVVAVCELLVPGARAARAESLGLWRGPAGSGGGGGVSARVGVSRHSRGSVILGERGSARARVAGFLAVHFFSHAMQV